METRTFSVHIHTRWHLGRTRFIAYTVMGNCHILMDVFTGKPFQWLMSFNRWKCERLSVLSSDLDSGTVWNRLFYGNLGMYMEFTRLCSVKDIYLILWILCHV